MTSNPLRLLVLEGSDHPDAEWRAVVSSDPSAFEVVEVENVEAARAIVAEGPAGSVMVSAHLAAQLAPVPEALLQHIGDGVGMVDAEGNLTWCNERLAAEPEKMRSRFVERCLAALDHFNRVETAGEADSARKFTFTAARKDYELVVSPAGPGGGEGGPVRAAVGVLWNVTSSRRLQKKIDAIDAAGSELIRIEGAAISKLDMAQRLRLLEEKIIHYVHDLLQFDNFEIRLLDRASNRLELVVAVGLTPLKIGEVIHAEAEGNGISGRVATTGRSYLCRDTRRDPLYREGLHDAGSSLTVPLRLHDEVIGVFNIESKTPDAFEENDRKFAEIFGRYIAMAMHILDLLVVERYTTNEQVSANVLSELSRPLEEITRRARALRGTGRGRGERATDAELERIEAAAEDLRQRIESCTRGPRTILGAEDELNKLEADPLLEGRRVIVADNEPEIRDKLEQILTQKGCDVTVCGSGLETIEALEASAREGRPYEMVISDIKMADRNGYEIFRTAKAVHAATHVILMTGFGYDPHHSIIRASQEGLHSLMFKPFKASQMLEQIEKALEKDKS